MADSRLNPTYATTQYNHWIPPTGPVSLSTELENVKLKTINIDELNVLTPKFANLIIEAAGTGSDVPSTMKSILTRIQNSYKMETDEDKKIHKMRQKFGITLVSGETIYVFDVDTTKNNSCAIVYGFSTGPGRMEFNVYNNDPSVSFDFKKKTLINRKDYHVMINQIDTYIVPYDKISTINYPSCPEEIHWKFMETTQNETAQRTVILRYFERIEQDIKDIRSRNNLVEYIKYFINAWKEIDSYDLRYYVDAFNKKQDIWKEYHEVVNTFITGSNREYQLKFFDEATLVKLYESITQVK